jgi:predicted DNA-binding transcriptional regulator AlpA
MKHEYSISCTTAVPFFKRIITGDTPMRLTRNPNCTTSRLDRKYLTTVLESLKNLYAQKWLPRHIAKMKNKKSISQEWVSQKWLTVKEVCEFLGISKSTFYKWRQLNIAPQTKRLPNGDLRIREDWLGAFLENLPEGGC